MKRTTFVFRTEKSYLRVWKALNDTMFTFTSFDDKEITVWGEAAINEVRNACTKERIKFTEV